MLLKNSRAMKLNKAADKRLDGIAETLTYMDFPEEHWKKIRTNNTIEQLNREIRRRTRVVGTRWGSKKYMDMKHLYGYDADNLLD